MLVFLLDDVLDERAEGFALLRPELLVPIARPVHGFLVHPVLLADGAHVPPIWLLGHLSHRDQGEWLRL